MRIDDEEYSIEYLRKAIRLYKDFETGALAKLLEEGMKKWVFNRTIELENLSP